MPSSQSDRDRLRADSTSALGKRRYRYVGLDWNDPDMRRAYMREAQRAWRAKNRPGKKTRP